MRWAIAAVVSSIVIFLWGFFFYGYSGILDSNISVLEDDEATLEVMSEHFPENGVYFFPNMPAGEEEMDVQDKKHQHGPVGVVFMTASEGRKMMDPGILYSGYCHILMTSIGLCMLLGLVNSSFSSWLSRVGFFIFVGFLMAFYNEIGNAVWWQYSWSWQFMMGLYDWVAISLGGLVIATITPFPEKED